MDILKDIEALMAQNLQQGRSPFWGTPLDRRQYLDDVAGLFSPRWLAIQEPKVQREADAIIVIGKTQFLGISGVPFSGGYQSLAGQCFFRLQTSLSEFKAFAVLDDFGSPLKDVNLFWLYGPLGLDDQTPPIPPTGQLRFLGQLKLGSLSLAVEVQPPQGDDRWHLSGAFDAVVLPGLDSLCNWLGLGDASAVFPSTLGSVGGFAISELSIVFDAKQVSIVSIDLGIISNAAWPLWGKHVVLRDLLLSIGLSRNDAKADLSLQARVFASLSLGGQELAVQVSLDSSSGITSLAILPDDDFRLPGLDDLAELVGEPKLLEFLPASVSKVNDLILREFELTLDLKAPALTSLRVDLGCPVSIPVAKDAFLEHTHLLLEWSPGDKATMTAEALIAVGNRNVVVSGELADQFTLEGTIAQINLAQLIPGLPPKLAELSKVAFAVRSDGSFRFTCAVAMDFHDLAAEFKIPLPDGLARVTLSELTIEANAAAGTWRLKAATPMILQFPATGPHHLRLSGIQIELHHEVQTTIQCQFAVSGQVALVPAFKLAVHAADIAQQGLTCRWKSGTTGYWDVDGTVTATIAKKDYPFDVRIAIEGESSRFGLRLRTDKPMPFADIDGIAVITASNLRIGLQKTGPKEEFDWSLAGDTYVDILDSLITAHGAVSLKNGELVITAAVDNAPQIELPLPLKPKPTVDIRLDPLQLKIGAAGSGGSTIEAGGAVTLRNVLPPADAVFPNNVQMQASLKIGPQTFELAFTPPGEPTLDVAFAKESLMEVRFPKVQLKKLLLERTGPPDSKQWGLGADLRVSQLNRLNRLFGGADLFEEIAQMKLSLGSGLSVVLKNSPLKALKLQPPRADGSVWTEWLDLPDMGNFSFRVPDFAFDFAGGRWHASGGIETRGTLKLPLSPIKAVLEKCSLPTTFLRAMPSSIPLLELDLSSQQFYDQLARMAGGLGPDAEAAFKKVAELLKDGIALLPAYIEEYLHGLSIPTGFTFDIAVEPSGGFSFGVRTSGDKPLKVLLPAMLGTAPPQPGLVGITLYSLSYGLSGGGSVSVLKADAWVDQIDAVSLSYALATGKGKTLSNRIVLRDTTVLIPMALPFPIPLFYAQLGWEYRDLFGIGMQFHARFPDPKPSLGDWVALIGDLIQFFTNKTFYLHKEDHLPERLALPFTLQPFTLTLPGYLGGATLGYDQTLPTLSVADTLARALDGIKSGNLGWVIQSIPLKWPKQRPSTWIRVRKQNITFGPLELAAVWCITTKEEFDHEVLPDKEAMQRLAVANTDHLLDILPQSTGDKDFDRGFIILLLGRLAAKTPLVDIFDFQCQFGMALLGPKRFETAVRLIGSFGPENALALGIEGRIKTQPHPDRKDTEIVKVKGSIYLIVAGKRLALSGGVTVVPGRSFETTIQLTLSDFISITGTLNIDANGVFIKGDVLWHDIGKFATQTVFSNQGLAFKPFDLTLGKFTCGATLSIPGKNKGDLFTVAITVDLPSSFSQDFKSSLKAVANDVVSKEVNNAYARLQKALASVKHLELSLTGLKQWLPSLCSDISGQIKRATTKKNVYAVMDTWANQPKKWVTRQGRKALVEVAKRSKPENKTQAAAQSWLKKLDTIRATADQPPDPTYRYDLQKALRDLLSPNEITIKVGKIGKFPGVKVFQRKPLLNHEQLTQINAAIDAIDKLPEADGKRVSAEQVLKTFPDKQQVMAQVSDSIDLGIDAGIPSVQSVGFETSVGFMKPADIILTTVFSFGDKPPVSAQVHVDLTRPDRTAKALAQAFANAF